MEIIKKRIQNFYKAIPFKKQLFLLIKYIFKPKKNIYQHLHFVGDIQVKVENRKTFKIRHYGFEVENEIFWNGIFNGWEKVSLTIWAELCSSANVIIDVGANTGVYALLAKTVNPKASVYAFEPVDRVYKKLVVNNNLNGYNIYCCKKAVSNYDGEATIYDKDIEHTYSVTVNQDISLNKEDSIPVTVDTIRLDTFINQEDVPKVDLIKIDVETHEVEVLEGIGKYIQVWEPTMIIEILNDQVAKGIENILSDLNYNYYVIDETSGINMVPSLRKSDYYNFLICKPEIAARLNSIKLFEKLY